MSKKKVLTVAASSVLGIALITLFFLFFSTKHISDYERASFEQDSAKIMNYLEAIDTEYESLDDDKLDKYIVFALLYSASENQKYTLNSFEIKTIIEDNFDFSVDEHRIEVSGISPTMTSYFVSKNEDDNSYSIKSDWTKKEIAKKPITKYVQQSLKKSGNKYTATYKKYICDDPYNIFSYANLNNLDTTGFSKYLENGENNNLFRNVINQENAEQLAGYKKDLTVTFELKNNRLVLTDIK